MEKKELKLNKKKYKILVSKDVGDKDIIKHENIWNNPFRLCFVGSSGSGKGSLLNLILIDPLNQFYHDLFKPENVYIVTGSKYDLKMKDLINHIGNEPVPEENITNEYNDEWISDIYDEIEDNKINDKSFKKTQSLFIFDDVSFSSKIREQRNNMLQKLYQNGRKYLINIIFTSQRYLQIPPSVRTNATGLVLWNLPNSELETIERDHNYTTSKKEFYKIFRENVKEKHHSFIIVYDNPHSDIYRDKDFEKIEFK